MIFLALILCVVLAFMLVFLMLPLKSAPLEKKSKIRYIATVSAVFFVASFGFYSWLGAPKIIDAIEVRNAKLQQLKTSITANSELVKTDSKNLGAWIELGQDFLETGQFSAASNAFRQSVLLSKGNPKLLLAYAKSLILSNDGAVGDDAKKALEMVLLQDKQNPEARYFTALYNLNHGKLPEAMSEMKALYHELPDGSPLKNTINQQIGRN